MTQHVTSLALPVVGVNCFANASAAATREVCGTAFTIGGGAYLTAGHVWKQAHTHAMQALGVMDEPERREFKLVKISDGELLEEFDLAVLKAPVRFGHTWRWTRTEASLLDAVETYGYPFAFDAQSGMVNVRAFKGSIIGGGPLKHLSARPPAWEVSFPCPRGLSGAPVIRTDPPPNQIVGVVLGNTITEMVVYEERETLAEHGHDHTFIKAALHLGVAIKADVVLEVTSSLLDCTIGAWLGRHGLVA